MYFVAIQSPSCVWLFATPWTAAHQASTFFTISQSLFKLMSITSVMPSNHLILCRPLLLPSICPASESFPVSHFFLSGGQSIGVSALAEYSALISFRINWLDLLAVQGTLKSVLQHHSSKASVLWCSAFFISIQFSHIYTWLLEKP